MSLPVSLTTDCGGLLNRRGPRRKCCCHTEALHAGYQVYSSHGWFLSRIIELSNWFIFTRSITEGHGCLSRICELSNFSSHGESRRVSGFMSRIIELSNFSSHGASRMVTVLLSRDLSFGPTDQREVICELSNFSSHGESRKVSGFMSRIIELSNFFSHGESRRFSLSRDMFLVTNLRDLSLDPLTNGRELSNFFLTRNVADGCGGYEGGTIEA